MIRISRPHSARQRPDPFPSFRWPALAETNPFPPARRGLLEIAPAQALPARVPDHVRAQDELEDAAPDVLPAVPDPDEGEGAARPSRPPIAPYEQALPYEQAGPAVRQRAGVRGRG